MARGAEPLLSDAQAYDTAALVRFLLDTSKPKDRRTFRQLLAGQSSFKGVTGPMRFDEMGEVVKDLFELTIEERQIKLWTKPKEPPQG